MPPSTIAAEVAYSLSNEEAERALRTGEHQGLLEEYFGAAQYQELRRLAQEASATRTRGGPRVLILPGILGSTIGIRNKIGPFDDVYWFDPIDIAVGNLTALALPSKKKFQPLGVVLFTYVRLKLQLELHGFDVDYFPFDWRFSIAGAAEKLLDQIFEEDKPVSLVAHSMGGLVARAALARKKSHAGVKRIARVVMLGPPNHGSFAPVQALRGTYGTVQTVARLDQRHNDVELAREVFGTFPGLYEMLPTAAIFSGVNLYDASAWPDDRPRPRQPLLSAVAKVQKSFAPGDERMFVIAGVNRGTAVGMRVTNNVVEYAVSKSGDGTVPLAYQLLDGARTWYVDELHGSLPNNSKVARAVTDILDRGDTNELPTEWSSDRALQWVPEDELETGPYQEAQWSAGVLTRARPAGPLSSNQIRHLIAEYAAPDSTEATTEPATYQLERVLVARQINPRVDVRFALGSITAVDARAYVLGIFEDVTPSGAAHAIDERMGGAITELTTRRMISGRVGEVFVMPAGRNDLRADFVAFVGLGPFDRFNAELQAIAAENVMRLFVRTNIEEFATVLFGAGSGGGAAQSLESLLTGFLRALKDADHDRRFRRLILAELDPSTFREMKEEFIRLSTTPLCAGVDLVFDEVTLPQERAGGVLSVAPAPSPAQPSRITIPSTQEQPVYLLIRTDKNTITASLLTAGGKATVVTESHEIDAAKTKQIKQSINNNFTANDLRKLGKNLADLMLPKSIQTVLKTTRDKHLVVVHDAQSSAVPWEILNIDDWFPAAEKGISHRYLAADLSIAKYLEERRQESTLRLLLVSSDPYGDLPGAGEEYDRIAAMAGAMSGLVVEGLRDKEATRPALLSALRSGRYDVFHYAGHAFFDEADPKSSAIVCAEGTMLTGADLAGVGNLPALMFFNACEAARVRRAARPADRTRAVQTSTGLAEAFLRGGVANYVGTYWPVSDRAAMEFATRFYTALFEGAAIGAAVLAARAAVSALPTARLQRDWADYVHYGNAQFALKVRR